MTLGVESAGGALPCTVRCPACRRVEMTLYQDTIQGGEWHHCRACGIRGDNVELACAAWEVGPQAAVDRLVAEGTLDGGRATAAAAEAYEGWYVRRRRQTEAFWEAARGHFMEGGRDTAALRQYLGVHGVGAFDWAERGGRMLGTALNTELSEWVKPATRFRRSGLPWPQGEDAGLLRFEDVPGRASAFLLVRQDRSGGLEKVYRHAFSVTPGPGGNAILYADAPGVGFLEAAFLPAQEALGDTLFVFLDPLLAVKTHLKQFSASDKVLPLVFCWHEARVPQVLADQSPRRDVVVWSRRADADLFRFARGLNARVVSHAGRREELLHLLRRHPSPKAWLATLSEAAVPWQGAMYERLEADSLVGVEALLNQTGMDAASRRAFVEAAPDGLRERLRKVRGLVSAGVSVKLDGKEVVEDEGGWRLGKGDYIVDAAVRIDTIYSRPGDDTWYQGRVLRGGREVPFTVRQADFDRSAFQCLRKAVQDARAGTLVYKETWTKKAFQLAAAFHEPKMVYLPERYGWDADGGRFVLPAFTVGPGGEVADNTAPPLRGGATPAACLAKPVEVAPDQLARLLEHRAAGVLWPALAVTLYNVLAPVYGDGPMGLALAGPGAPLALAALEACGCPRVPVAYKGHNPLGPVERAAGLGSWPVAVAGVPMQTVATAEWLQTNPNAAVELDPTAGRVLAASGGWFFLEADKFDADEADVRLLSLVVPDFLRHLMRKGPGSKSWSQTPFERLEAQLVAYVEDRGLDAKGLGDLLWPVDPAPPCGADLFVQVLLAFRRDRLFRVEDEAEARARGGRPNLSGRVDARPVLRLTREHASVLKADLQALLRKRRLPPLDAAAVDRHLRDAGWGEGDEQEWRVNRPWWDARAKAYESGDAKAFGVVG